MSPETALVCWLLASGAEACSAPLSMDQALSTARQEAPDDARGSGRVYTDDTWKYRDVTGKPRAGPSEEIGHDDVEVWQNLR